MSTPPPVSPDDEILEVDEDEHQDIEFKEEESDEDMPNQVESASRHEEEKELQRSRVYLLAHHATIAIIAILLT